MTAGLLYFFSKGFDLEKGKEKTITCLLRERNRKINKNTESLQKYSC